MNEKEIKERIAELKMDYVRIQNDLEKLESVGQNVSHSEKQLAAIEDELSELKKALAKNNK